MKYTKILVPAIIKAIESAPAQVWWNVRAIERRDDLSYAVVAFENLAGVQHRFIIAGDTLSVIYGANLRGAKSVCSFDLPHLTRDTLMLGIGSTLFRLNLMYNANPIDDDDDDE